MIGMIKKDLLMIKNNSKSIIISFMIFVFYSFAFDMDMSFFLPFMGLMLCNATFSYDEYNNWYSYSTTFPQGKTNAVKAKYLTTIGMTLFLSILSVIFNCIICLIGKENIVLSEMLFAILFEFLLILFMMSILYPLTLKYGTEKSRIALVVICFSIAGIFILLKEIFKIEISSDTIKFFENYLPYIFVIVTLIMLSISYFISKKIYLKREF